ITVDGSTWSAITITETWARFSTTVTPSAGSRTAGIRLATNGDAVEIWGAQLEQRSSVTAYTPTTNQPITRCQPQLMTAAANVARFDHNPITGESLGLLIEEQRTNLLNWSQEFNSWPINLNTAVAANTTVAPDGTITGDTLI
ncbi:phage head spike fiber domain-containing protein, partial [Pseudomonas aeruginosa]|uniref:phage head spike fiber domain-containing protein n=1 Tax=Pseudomonas aeruginosa TaxID=287 RepID=UPI002095AC79